MSVIFNRALFVKLSTLLIVSLCVSCSTTRPKLTVRQASQKELLQTINKVNSYWQLIETPEQRAFWDVAVYHTGNMEAYSLTKSENYKKYSETWAEYNQWMGAKSDDKSKWRYSYGEKDDFVLFGDWQACFQTYIDLYKIAPDKRKISRALEVMEYEMSTDRTDYWWWIDGVYMVMPVMVKLYKVTGNRLYLEKMYEYWSHATSVMYDKQEMLYYRDSNFVYPKHRTLDGKKDFWARGDGWIFAAFAKVLQDLPVDDKHRAEYVRYYVGMAKALKKAQQPGGFWTRSLLDPQFVPGPESSGTSLFTYGLLWGINNGYLNKKEFEPVAIKGWDFLNRVALQPNGKVGYVQPIGAKAIPGQFIDQNSTSNFGVGTFLLAACEMYRYAGQK